MTADRSACVRRLYTGAGFRETGARPALPRDPSIWIQELKIEL